MPSVKEVISALLVTAAMTAIIFRVPMLRSAVTGLTTDPGDGKSRKPIYV